VYPVGIPANMIFALMLGTSIVRYRLFAVAVAVKKTAVYALVGTVITTCLGVAGVADRGLLPPQGSQRALVIVPVGAIITCCCPPLGQGSDDRIQRMMFSKRQGCYETLLHLSKRMSSILNFNELVDTLVHGLVRGIPATHATLMIHDPGTGAFLNYREETTLEEARRWTRSASDSPVVQWLTSVEGLLVKEEVKLNPRIAKVLRDGRGRAGRRSRPRSSCRSRSRTS
jgi:hypothetical protein